MNELKELNQFLDGLELACFTLFQSGFASVQDSAVKELEQYSEVAKEYGLFYASDALKELKQLIEGGRHQFHTDFTEAAKVFSRLNRYVALCLKKVELMQVKCAMEQAQDDGEETAGE